MLDGPDGWQSCPTDVSAPVVWTVDRGPQDITRLMRSVLSAPLIEALTGTLAGLNAMNDDAATRDGLMQAMAGSPALVVTSSHGATPLDLHLLAEQLGLPVDVEGQTVPLTDLTSSIPGGSVWFAQACCSAGSAGESSYSGLLKEGTTARLAVDAVASLGSTVAPGPMALLRRDPPVRAVFGHVEPTFDWTLKDGDNNQRLAGDVVAALSSNLHHGQPLGLVLADYREGIGVLTTRWIGLSDRLNLQHDQSVLPAMTRTRLTAWDRQSLVLLGDPTVRIPQIL
jgi:hypothetical protein